MFEQMHRYLRYNFIKCSLNVQFSSNPKLSQVKTERSIQTIDLCIQVAALMLSLLKKLFRLH